MANGVGDGGMALESCYIVTAPFPFTTELDNNMNQTQVVNLFCEARGIAMSDDDKEILTRLLHEFGFKGYEQGVREMAQSFSGRRKATMLAEHVTRVNCDHDWVDAKNEVVAHGELCLKCGSIRP